MKKDNSYCYVPCPICSTRIYLDWEEYKLAIQSQSWMCWDGCGYDAFAPSMYWFMNKVELSK